MRCVAGKKIKGRGGNQKPLNYIHPCAFVVLCLLYHAKLSLFPAFISFKTDISTVFCAAYFQTWACVPPFVTIWLTKRICRVTLALSSSHRNLGLLLAFANECWRTHVNHDDIHDNYHCQSFHFCAVYIVHFIHGLVMVIASCDSLQHS